MAIGPLNVRSWDLLDGLGGVPGAGSSLGAIADAGKGLGGISGAGSCLYIASSDAMAIVINCD